MALGYVGGILCGADKLSRVIWLQSDAAVAAMLGVAAIASQSALSRFFGVFTQKSCGVLGGLHSSAVDSLPSLRERYTLDLDRGRTCMRTAIRQGWRWVAAEAELADSPANGDSSRAARRVSSCFIVVSCVYI